MSEKALEQFLHEKANTEENRNAVLISICSGKDIVPGVIEGGFTVWNGSRQMVDFLISHKHLESLRTKRILDLGCGAGIPGLAALKVGASAVTFQVGSVQCLRIVCRIIHWNVCYVFCLHMRQSTFFVLICKCLLLNQHGKLYTRIRAAK